MSRLRDNVERWLIHENYDFKQGKSDDATFKIIINNSDGLGNDTEVFEPKGQENILVVGIKIDMKTKQLIRFRELNETEQENFKKKVDDFCYSIKAVGKFLDEDGKPIETEAEDKPVKKEEASDEKKEPKKRRGRPKKEDKAETVENS